MILEIKDLETLQDYINGDAGKWETITEFITTREVLQAMTESYRGKIVWAAIMPCLQHGFRTIKFLD